MRQQETRIVCDECDPPRSQALVTCEAHAVDLCERHMRKHFDPAACRLMPVQREPTQSEESLDKLEALQERTQTEKPMIKELLRKVEGEGQVDSDEVLKCLKEDREVPAGVMERLEPGKRVFLENWNRLCKRLSDLNK